MTPLRFRNKRYKAILIEDGSTISTGFSNAITARATMENHKDYGLLRYGKDYKIVRDYEAEEQAQPAKEAQ